METKEIKLMRRHPPPLQGCLAGRLLSLRELCWLLPVTRFRILLPQHCHQHLDLGQPRVLFDDRHTLLPAMCSHGAPLRNDDHSHVQQHFNASQVLHCCVQYRRQRG